MKLFPRSHQACESVPCISPCDEYIGYLLGPDSRRSACKGNSECLRAASPRLRLSAGRWKREVVAGVFCVQKSVTGTSNAKVLVCGAAVGVLVGVGTVLYCCCVSVCSTLLIRIARLHRLSVVMCCISRADFVSGVLRCA